VLRGGAGGATGGRPWLASGSGGEPADGEGEQAGRSDSGRAEERPEKKEKRKRKKKKLICGPFRGICYYAISFCRI
jgi:hypothetical protein